MVWLRRMAKDDNRKADIIITRKKNDTFNLRDNITGATTNNISRKVMKKYGDFSDYQLNNIGYRTRFIWSNINR